MSERHFKRCPNCGNTKTTLLIFTTDVYKCPACEGVCCEKCVISGFVTDRCPDPDNDGCNCEIVRSEDKIGYIV